MKKLICIFLSCILVFNSVIVYADTGGSFDPYGRVKEEHPDWFDENGHVKPAGSELFSHMVVPDLIGGEDVVDKIASLTGGIQEFLNSYDNSNDDVTIQYDDKGETVTENNYSESNFYVYFNQNFTKNLTEKVQDSVHALDGYYLIEPTRTFTVKDFKSNYTTEQEETFNSYVSRSTVQFRWTLNQTYLYCLDTSLYYYYFSSDGQISQYTISSNKYSDNSLNGCCGLRVVSTGFDLYPDGIGVPGTMFGNSDRYYYNLSNILYYVSGQPFKVFYTRQDLQNYLGNDQKRTYAPKLPSGGLKVPLSYIKGTANLPDLNINLDSLIGKAEADIQADIDLALKNYFDKLLELNNNTQPTNPTPTPSHGGSSGDFGDGTTPTPTPSISDGGDDSGNGKVDLSEITDLLKKILNKLTSFTDSHTKFEKTITDYIEANDGKLDDIIEAINALSDGKTEDEKNGCKYDFTALSEYMEKLWNNSDQKFDKMISLLEENNEYQQELVDRLDAIKKILVTQTILEAFQNRSKETADKAKEKFPTSVPWDIAMMVNAMAAEPQTPKFSLPININSLNIHETIEVDLSNEEWEKLAKTCRYMLSLLFILFMVQLSRKLFFNGGDD